MDARVARTLATVRQAATELLVQGGPGAVTVDAIVARSGVAKSTIYRHWESRDELLADVVQCMAPAFEEPPADLPFEPALRSLMATLVRSFADPEWSRVVPAVLLLKLTEERIAGVERDLNVRQQEIFECVLQRGVDEGAIRAGLDAEEVAAMLVGPVLFAQVSEMLTVDEALGDRIVDHFLAAERALLERTTTPAA
jgi:AcrR family transcriptional regulator